MKIKKTFSCLFACWTLVLVTCDFGMAQETAKEMINKKLESFESRLIEAENHPEKLKVVDKSLAFVENAYDSAIEKDDELLAVDLAALKNTSFPILLSLREVGIEKCSMVKSRYLYEFNAKSPSELRSWEAQVWGWLVDICKS